MNTVELLNKVLDHVEAGTFRDPIAPCDRDGGHWDRRLGGTKSIVVRRGVFGARLIHDATSSCPSGLCGMRAYVHVFRDPLWWVAPKGWCGPIEGPFVSVEAAQAHAPAHVDRPYDVVRSAYDVMLTEAVMGWLYDSTGQVYKFGQSADGTAIVHQAIPVDVLLKRYAMAKAA